MRANLIILSKIKDEVGGFSIEIPRFNGFFFIYFAYRCQIPADISSSICLALSMLLLGINICRITQCSGLPLPTFFFVFHVLVMFCKNIFLYDLPLP